MPWYMKLFLALGGTGVLWGLVSRGIPQAVAWLLPVLVKITDKLMAWLLSKPAVRKAVVKYKPEILDTLKQFFAAIDKLEEAVEAEIEKDIEETKDDQ